MRRHQHPKTRTTPRWQCLYSFIVVRQRLVFSLLLTNLLFFVLMYMSASSEQDNDPNRPRQEYRPPLRSIDTREFIYDDRKPEDGRDDAQSVVRRKIILDNLRIEDNLGSEEDSESRDPFVRETYIEPILNVPCDSLKRPPDDRKQDFRWHPVDQGSRDSFVFSAYFDPRTDPSSVKVIGVSAGLLARTYCQIWYTDQLLPVVVTARYNIVPETHDYKYAPSFFVCPTSRRSPPYAVSVTSSKCEQPSYHIQVLAPRDRKHEHTFTVCVSPLNLNYDDIHSFVEMMEMNRILGADKIVLYNHTTGRRVDRYLQHYIQEGFVELIPWQIPLEVHVKNPDPLSNPEIHYFGQIAAINDCLYRYMYQTKYTVFTDLDELLIPRVNTSWSEMMQNITASTSSDRRYGAFLFRNTFFRIDWPDDDRFDHGLDVKYKLRTQLKLNREDRIWEWYFRTKYMLIPKMVDVVGIHFVFNFIRPYIAHRKVPFDTALLHHYRDWGDEEGLPEHVHDPYLRQYRAFLYEAVTRVHKMAGFL